MKNIKAVHHVAIICSDYEKSKAFYTEVLGLRLVAEHYRTERQSYKTDLALDNLLIELFSFPDPPKRVTGPEACGLRHIAFVVSNIDEAVRDLNARNIVCEDIRVDQYTGRRFTFFPDPDNLPIELYES